MLNGALFRLSRLLPIPYSLLALPFMAPASVSVDPAFSVLRLRPVSLASRFSCISFSLFFLIFLYLLSFSSAFILSFSIDLFLFLPPSLFLIFLRTVSQTLPFPSLVCFVSLLLSSSLFSVSFKPAFLLVTSFYLPRLLCLPHTTTSLARPIVTLNSRLRPLRLHSSVSHKTATASTHLHHTYRKP